MTKKGSSQVMLLGAGGLAIIILTAILIFYKKPQETSPSIGMPAPGFEDVPEMVVGDGEFGEYIEFTPQALEDRASRTRVLFFYANWCPICRPVDQELKTKANELPGNVTVIRVNYNDDETDEDEKSLAEKYGITYQHTFVVIDENGNELKKWNGGDLGKIIAETS